MEIAKKDKTLWRTPIGELRVERRYGALWWVAALSTGLVVELEIAQANSWPLDLPIGRRTGELAHAYARDEWRQALRSADSERIAANELGRLRRLLEKGGPSRPFRETDADDVWHEINRRNGG